MNDKLRLVSSIKYNEYFITISIILYILTSSNVQ